MNRTSELLLASSIFLFCLFTYFYLIPTIPLGFEAEEGGFTPRSFPSSIVQILGVLSIIMFVKALRIRDLKTPSFALNQLIRPVIVVVVGVVYIKMLEMLGYLIATPIILFFFQYIFGAKKPVKMIVVAIVTTVALYFFFGKAFNVMLPVGSLIS